MGIDDLCRRHGFVTAASLAKALRISRQAAHRQLAAAVAAGTLVAEGQARARKYLPSVPVVEFRLKDAAEDEVLATVRARLGLLFQKLTPDEDSLLAYVFSEMVNNAIDHSCGKRGSASVEIQKGQIALTIGDDGIGAFESLRQGRDLTDHIEAAAELTKGKVTTMPSRHSGEGVFFTSKVVDHFEIVANGVSLVIDNDVGDCMIREVAAKRGTQVHLRVRRPPARTMQQVFAAWTDGFVFSKTRTVVKLFGLGRDFVSRSEARRMLRGLEAFREVVVDFTDVAGIGQGFADEVFRVFPQQHPSVRMIPVNMVEAVRFFVARAERSRSDTG